MEENQKKIVIREPNYKELKKFQRKVVESLEVRKLKAEVERLHKEVIYWTRKVNHLDKLSKEDYISLMKELKQMKIESKISELEEQVKKAKVDLKSSYSKNRRQLEEIIVLKVRLKEL